MYTWLECQTNSLNGHYLSEAAFGLTSDVSTMNSAHIVIAQWRAICPRCSHVEASNEHGINCPNCTAPAALVTLAVAPPPRFLSCTRDCGWSTHRLTCSKCQATIEGKFFLVTKDPLLAAGEAMRGAGCFVATAAFNDIDHPTVDLLRKWRDEVLMTFAGGRWFVAYYYRNGMKWSRILSSIPELKPVVRWTLNTLMFLCYRGRR